MLERRHALELHDSLLGSRLSAATVRGAIKHLGMMAGMPWITGVIAAIPFAGLRMGRNIESRSRVLIAFHPEREPDASGLVAIRNAPLHDRERAFIHPLVLANGAFSFVALMALRALDELGSRTHKLWTERIRQTLPSQDYPQSPQLSCHRQPEALDRARLTSMKVLGLAALLLTLTTPAAADGYFGLLGVRSFNSTSTSNSDRIETGEEDRLGGGVLAGLELTRWALLEAELGYASADLHGYNPTPRRELAHGEVRVGYGLVSLGLLAPLPYVQPYLIAGLGFALESVDGRVDGRGRIDDTSAVVAHRYGVGLRIPLRRAAVRTELRHFEAGAVQQDQVLLAVQIGLP